MASKWYFFSAALILSVFTESSCSPDHQPNATAEHLILYRLMVVYDGRMPPVRPLELDVVISPIKIIDVDADNGLLTVDLRLIYSWEDHRLVWEDVVEKMTVPSSYLYVPEMELLNGYMKPLLSDPKRADAVVSNTGHVSLNIPVRAEVYCDLPKTPLRHTVCNITMGPWNHDTSYTILTSDGSTQYPSSNLQTGRCSIDQSYMLTHLTRHEGSPGVYSLATLFLAMGCQETGGCALPVALAPFFVLLVFLMPPKSTDRVLVGSMVFLFQLIIWASGRITDEQVNFLQLSACTTIAATFASLISCKIFSAVMALPGVHAGDTKNEHPWKTRLVTMLDLAMFVSVAAVLILATARTFS